MRRAVLFLFLFLPMTPSAERIICGPTTMLLRGETGLHRAIITAKTRRARGRLEADFPELRGVRITVDFHPGRAPSRSGDLYNAGWSAGRHILLQNCLLLLGQGRLEETLRHELTHTALSLLGRRRLPLWLEEGTAFLLSGQPPEGDPFPAGIRSPKSLSRALRRRSRQGGFASWKELRPLYHRAWKMTARLASGDRPRFFRFLRTLKQGAPFRPALSRVYGLTEAALWRQCE